MINDHHLYPELPESGGKEAQRLLDKFKEDLIKITNDAIGDLYTDVAIHIESDSWTNYRNSMMAGFRNYNNRIGNEYDFKAIRQQIYEEFKDEIIVDLNQDLVKEVEDLKEMINILQSRRF